MHIVKEIISRPDFPELLDQLNSAWEEEQKRLQKFLEEITEDDKAEFINGEIVTWNSPVRVSHWKVSLKLSNAIFNHLVASNSKAELAVEKALVSMGRNKFEPDLCFFSEKQALTFKPDQMILPPPIWICEITSPSTEENDRGIKFQEYARHGVEEYWIIDAEKRTLEQYVNENGEYSLVLKLQEGRVTSKAIEGFVLERIEELFG